MKRYISHLLHRPRILFENAHLMGRVSGGRMNAASTGLLAEDGYDWLPQIRLAPAEQSKLR